MHPSFRVVSGLVVLLLSGSVSADRKGGGNTPPQQGDESVVARSCPFTTDTEAKTREALNSQLNTCFKSPNGTDLMEGLHAAETAEDIRSFILRFCAMKTFTRQCADNINALSELCLNETQRTALLINVNFVRLLYVIGCAQGGERAANSIVDGWRFNNATIDSVVDACAHVASNQLVLRGATDVTVVSTQHYRMVKAFKECIVSSTPQGSSLANFADVILTDILKALQCIDQYRVVVLCESIDNN